MPVGFEPRLRVLGEVRELHGAGLQALVGVFRALAGLACSWGAPGGRCRRDHPGGVRELADTVPEPGRRPPAQGVVVSPCGQQAGTVLGSRYSFHWKNSPILNIGSKLLKNCKYIQFPDKHSLSELACFCRACRGWAPGPVAATGWGQGRPAEGQEGRAGRRSGVPLLAWPRGLGCPAPRRTQGADPHSRSRSRGRGATSPSRRAAAGCTLMPLTPAHDSKCCAWGTLGYGCAARLDEAPAAGRQEPGANPGFRGSQGGALLWGSEGLSPGVALGVEGAGCAHMRVCLYPHTRMGP